MIIVSNYELVEKSLNFFYVRCTEVVPSPCCGEYLKSIGSRKRKVIKDSGEYFVIVIRRLRCINCRKIHHELPDFIVPYKRYESSCIERVVSEPSDVIFDPADISELTIDYDGHAPWQVRELVIGERAGKRPPLPEHMLNIPADSSRLLNAAEKKSRERYEIQAPAVTYRKVMKEEEEHHV